jgi:cytochrome d ubiquinol oxidase subunit I
LENLPRLAKGFIWLIPLPYLANTAGWLLTEMGRVPWIVFGLMKISEGISLTVPAWTVGLSLVGYTLIYGALMVANIYLLTKFARRGVVQEKVEQPVGIPALNLVGD